MALFEEYLQRVTSILQRIAQDEEAPITQAATLVADKVQQDELVHVFGTGGHSVMGAMEVFWRAGGFANVNPLFPAGLSLVDSHPNIERIAGMAESTLLYYGVGQNDVLIIVNVNGINPLTIESALKAKELGAHVIAVTSPEFSKHVPAGLAARHSSNRNLYEVAEVVIDAHVPAGDAVLRIPGMEPSIGATSTYAVCFALNLVFIKAAEILVGRSVTPPVWTSANVKGGDDANLAYLAKYRGRVHHLYPMF